MNKGLSPELCKTDKEKDVKFILTIEHMHQPVNIFKPGNRMKDLR